MNLKETDCFSGLLSQLVGQGVARHPTHRCVHVVRKGGLSFQLKLELASYNPSSNPALTLFW